MIATKIWMMPILIKRMKKMMVRKLIILMHSPTQKRKRRTTRLERLTLSLLQPQLKTTTATWRYIFMSMSTATCTFTTKLFLDRTLCVLSGCQFGKGRRPTWWLWARSHLKSRSGTLTLRTANLLQSLVTTMTHKSRWLKNSTRSSLKQRKLTSWLILML